MTEQNKISEKIILEQNSPETKNPDINRIMSLVKSVRSDVLKMFGKGIDENEIREIAELVKTTTSAEDFMKELGREDESSSALQKVYERMKTAIGELESVGLNPGQLEYENASEYLKKYYQSLFEIRRLMAKTNTSRLNKPKSKSLEIEKIEKRLEEDGLKSIQKKALLKRLKDLKENRVEELAPTNADIALKAQENQRTLDSKVDTNYFDWLAYYSYIIYDYIESFRRSGTLVITPHIQKILDEMESSPKSRPVFLKGDLGSGKTEMAIYQGKLLAEKNKSEILKRLKDDGFNVVNDEEIKSAFEAQEEYGDYEEFREAYCKEYKVLTEALALMPILLSGNKEFDPAQFIGGFEITTPEKYDERSVRNLFEQAKESIKDLDLPKDEAEKLRDTILDFKKPVGIQTKAYLGKLFQAMKYGKTLIIDEVNAMPHEILILLNHYLTRKPGDEIQPPINNLPPFKIAKGYSIILTGNIPKEGQSGYTGRQMLDAAFRNRLHEIEVEYLPNTTLDDFTLPAEYAAMARTFGYDKARTAYFESIDNEERKKFRRGGIVKIDESEVPLAGEEKNELYHVLCTFGLDRGIVTRLPKNYFEKLRNLSKAAKVMQDAFAGKKIDAKFFGKNTKGSLSLKRAVPSMRDLTLIVEKWKEDGFRLSLDKYVWKYFVQKFSDDKGEQEFVYGVLKNYGFFNDDYFREKLPDENLQNLQMIGHMDYLEETLPLHTFSQEEILEQLFGPSPKKTEEETELISGAMPEKVDLESIKEEMIDEIRDEISRLQEGLGEVEQIYMKYCSLS